MRKFNMPIELRNTNSDYVCQYCGHKGRHMVYGARSYTRCKNCKRLILVIKTVIDKPEGMSKEEYEKLKKDAEWV